MRCPTLVPLDHRPQVPPIAEHIPAQDGSLTELIRRSNRLLLARERSGNMIMTGKTVSPENSNRIKNPDDWITGDEEMTGAQESYLQTLAEEATRVLNPI
jgi:hypothetical protein